MKKISMLLTVSMCLFITSCSQKEIQGAKLIEKAQEEMDKLNSATVIIKNEKENKTEQSFSFVYNESTDVENKGVIHNTVYRIDIKEKN